MLFPFAKMAEKNRAVYLFTLIQSDPAQKPKVKEVDLVYMNVDSSSRNAKGSLVAQ